MPSENVRRRALPVAVGLVVGVGGAVVARFVDAALGDPEVVSTANARALLASTFAAVVTIGAFAFWMRPVAVQLAAATVPPRSVASHLYDRFQQRVVGAAVAALTFEAVALLSLPSSSGAPAPFVSSVSGALIGVGAITALLVAVEHAERSTRPTVLVSESAHAVIDHIRTLAHEPTDVEPDPALDDRRATTVTTTASGWVRAVDAEGLLDATPEGGTVRIDSDVGAFVVAGWTPVASVWPGGTVSSDAVERMRRSFRIGERRAGPADVTGSLAQFADIAVQAATGGSSAPSVVYEAMWYLGAILHELTGHERLGRPDRRLADGRVLLAPTRADAAQLADLAVDRIRRVTASSPAMALELVRVLTDARRAAAQRGRSDLVEVLDRQADLTVAQCRHADPLPADVERVVAARRPWSEGGDAGARDEEYGGGREPAPQPRPER